MGGNISENDLKQSENMKALIMLTWEIHTKIEQTKPQALDTTKLILAKAKIYRKLDIYDQAFEQYELATISLQQLNMDEHQKLLFYLQMSLELSSYCESVNEYKHACDKAADAYEKCKTIMTNSSQSLITKRISRLKLQWNGKLLNI